MNHSRRTISAASARSVFEELAPAETLVPVVRTGARDDPRNIVSLSDRRAERSHHLGHSRATTLSFRNMNEYGDLLVRYLMARKAVFVDRLNWSVPCADGMEFDQYDTPLCRWVVIHEFGEILAGIRLVPTTARCGLYSYMLRDAQMGLLEGIPRDVLFFDAPVADYLWEASRLFVSESVPAQRRNYIQTMLMREMSASAVSLGARHVIGIVPAVWSRWLRRLGLYAAPVGPKFSIDGTISQSALFNVLDHWQWKWPDEDENFRLS